MTVSLLANVIILDAGQSCSSLPTSSLRDSTLSCSGLTPVTGLPSACREVVPAPATAGGDEAVSSRARSHCCWQNWGELHCTTCNLTSPVIACAYHGRPISSKNCTAVTSHTDRDRGVLQPWPGTLVTPTQSSILIHNEDGDGEQEDHLGSSIFW